VVVATSARLPALCSHGSAPLRQQASPRPPPPCCHAGLRELVVDGAYTLVLEFESSIQLSQWEEFQPKIQSFFGPGIVATVAKTSTGADVALIADGSGAGRGGGERKEVLPPLMPGLKPRQQ
jgi:hypothetical protein